MELLILGSFTMLAFGAGYGFRGLVGREIKKVGDELKAEFAKAITAVKAEAAKF